MPAPRLSPAVHVLHRGPSRVGLCAHPEERDLRQGLQPRIPARSGTDRSSTPRRARDGFFFDATLRRLFSLVGQGCGAAIQQSVLAGSVKEAFALAPLDSKLFDPDATPLLNQVRFPNHVWQRVIRLMSLSERQSARGASAISCCRSTSWVPSMKRCFPIVASLPRKIFTRCSRRPRKPPVASSAAGDDDDDEGESESAGGTTDVHG